MMKYRKRKLKKFYFHPITVFIFLTLFVMVLSAICSAFQMQATYDTVNKITGELEPNLVTVENLFNFYGLNFLISSASKNFISFAPLGMLLISMIGVSVAEASGFTEALAKRHLRKVPKSVLTYFIILIAIFSSLINDIGYVILIPLVASIYLTNKRNPILGIVTAFCAVAYGYGVSLFIGSMEVSLIPYTTSAAYLIDGNAHIALTSNLFFIIFTTIALSFAGTFVVEKFIAPKIGKYREGDDISKTLELEYIDLEKQEQQKLEKDRNENRGLRFAMITAIVVTLAFIYMIIPGLPRSGLLLDMSQKTYLNQLFGEASYFQDGFTYLICILFLTMGLAYSFGAHKFKNDKQLIENSSKVFSNLGSVIILIFVVSQFIAVFKKTNIGIVITAWLANLLNHLSFSGIALIIAVILLIAVSNLFLTTPAAKWQIFSPVVVPMLMQSNISAPFAQVIMRAGDSITNGMTPLLAAFVVYIGFLNVYNLHKDKPITIRKAIGFTLPYFWISMAIWIFIIVAWYLIGLPIGPGVYPTI
ncbi:MAG: AbgT family transporter [Bacilli bacterium]|nr:AbgT family transporter [Bacilli bacterium]